MNTTEIQNLLKKDTVKHKLGIAYIIYMAIITIGLLLIIPYDRTLFLYIVPISYFGPYIIIFTLYIPFFIIFKAFGKETITGPIGIILSVILEVSVVISSGLHIPMALICLVYFLTGTNVILCIATFLIGGYIGYRLEETNKRLSNESNIDSVLSIRKEWMNVYLKWSILVLVCIACLMGIGIYRHKYFTMIDCVVLSLQSAIIIFQVVLSPYYNTYNNKYSEKEFAFFLRSFKIENEKEEDIISDIHNGLHKHSFFHAPRILRIGNPSLLMYSPQLGADTFFLPSENWQPVVRKYVNEAKIIIVLINVNNKIHEETKFTQGVIWELYHNYPLRDKFIYCIDKFSEQDSHSFIEVLDVTQKQHPLTTCIVKLLDEHKNIIFDNDQCAFTFDGKYCQCYENLSTAIKANLSSDGNEINHSHSFSIY
jgi:hypothetical protein